MCLQEIMVAKIIQCSAVAMTVLSVVSVAMAQVDSCTDYQDDVGKSRQRQLLLELFEEAMNDSYTRWKLQQIYFNPDSNHSPGKVCLTAFVTVETIANPHCPCTYQHGPAFASDAYQWHFNSYYELQLADDTSDTSELAKLMTESGSTSVFYTFDPSFFSILKTLSSSITVYLPYDFPEDVASYYYSEDYTGIDISISTLDEMPCLDDVTYTLRSALMWVS